MQNSVSTFRSDKTWLVISYQNHKLFNRDLFLVVDLDVFINLWMIDEQTVS